MYKDRRGKFNELDLQTVACHTAVGLTDSFNCKFNNLLIIDQGNKGSPVWVPQMSYSSKGRDRLTIQQYIHKNKEKYMLKGVGARTTTFVGRQRWKYFVKVKHM